MNLSRSYLIILILISCSSSTVAQFTQNFDLEVGISRNNVYNLSKIYSHDYSIDFQAKEIDIIKESHSSAYNYSISLGYRLAPSHHIRIRHSRYILGGKLTGKIICYSDDLSYYQITLSNTHNKIKNHSLGLLYEFFLSINSGNLSMSVGGEKQWNGFDEILVSVPGINSTNYALYASIGYLYPLFNHIQIHGKLHTIRSFANKQESAFSFNNSEYIPIQLGFELAIRYNLANGKNI